MTIQSLPKDVINLIAAGEVIDSLAAVVRELVENAIDAAATNIVISLYPELWRLQVADNGQGMTLEDLQCCSKAHSTSKIRTREDLWKITSLGFRGEALHSIAQVADLEIVSRPQFDDNSVGWRMVYDRQGHSDKIETVAIAPGTIITVANLFAHLPVRRKGLPPLAQQLKTIQTLIGQIALCHPHLTWQVLQNNRSWFRISPCSGHQHLLPQLLKSLHATDLQVFTLEVEVPDAVTKPSKIELVIGLPDRCHRPKPDWIKVAVNRRTIRSPELEQTIIKAFSRTLPRDRYPLCFLHLHTCPSQIDWNRHPAKSEIYLHSLSFWQEQVIEAINQALCLNSNTLPIARQNQRVTHLLKASEEKTTYQIGIKTEQSSDSISLLELEAVAQIRNTYIVAEHANGLWLVEQHIAHERVLYEQLQAHWELVELETPIVLQHLKTSQIEQLQRLELDIEPFGEQVWAIRTAPAMLIQREDCRDALMELSCGGDLQTAQVATACRSAIRNGTSLTLEEMQTLLNQWQRTRNPRTCPHGRPIYLSLEETSLARFFRRHWVIGKSHGI